MSDVDSITATVDQILPVPGATIPYWRTQPHRIDEFRSSDQLLAECDIAIIGAGMAGVTTAYHLAKLAGAEKPSIVILEARQVCSGATGRNGGHVKVRSTTIRSLIERHGLEVAEQHVAFVTELIYALKDVVESEDLDCEFELRRSFDTFIDETDAKEAEELFHESTRTKRRWARDVDFVSEKYAEQVTSIKGARAALSMPVCSFWPYKFVAGLLERLLDTKEVELYTWTPVTRLEHDKQAEGTFVYTGRGVVKAKKVIFATNAYTGGLCDQYVGGITPVKGTACHIVPQPSRISPHLSNTYNIFYERDGLPERVDYLNPRPDGSIVVGGGKWKFEEARDEWYNNWDDSTLLPGAIDHFDGLMQRTFAGWQDSGAVVDHLWTGIMGETRDMAPHIGEVPGLEGQQYIIAGFNGGGNSLIFLCARGLARMVLDQASFEQTGLPRLFKTSRERLLEGDRDGSLRIT